MKTINEVDTVKRTQDISVTHRVAGVDGQSLDRMIKSNETASY